MLNHVTRGTSFAQMLFFIRCTRFKYMRFHADELCLRTDVKWEVLSGFYVLLSMLAKWLISSLTMHRAGMLA